MEFDMAPVVNEMNLVTFSGGLLDEDDALLNGENVSPELRGGEGAGGRRGRGRRDGIERRRVNLYPLVDAIATWPRRAHGNPPCCYLTHDLTITLQLFCFSQICNFKNFQFCPRFVFILL